MPSMNPRSSANGKRNPYAFSCDDREARRRDAILRAAWMRIVASFKCRPDPRGPWDEAATGDVTPWRQVIEPVRNAIASAVFNGNPVQIRETVDAACAFCDELKADFRSMVSTVEEESVVPLAMDETHLEGPANEAEMAVVKNPDDPCVAESAILPLERHGEAIGKLVRALRLKARSARPTSVAGGVR